MNLFSVAHSAVNAVQPTITVTIRISTGYTTNADGSRSPAYAPAITVQGRVQALQYNDISQADSLSIQGVRRKLYVYGEVDGLVRAQNKGGDLVTLPDGTVWKIAMIAEAWPQWTSAIITLQDNS